MGLKEFISENKGAIAFSVIFMLLLSGLYFALGPKNLAIGQKEAGGLFDGAKFKTVSGPDGSLNIFVSAKSNKLAELKTSQGNPIPESNSIVLGSEAAANLKKQAKFSKVGNHLVNYFGINTTIEGVLQKRNDLADELVFLGSEQFDAVSGESNRAYVMMSKDGLPNLFFRLEQSDNFLGRFSFIEGGTEGYSTHDLGGNVYYPIILGYKQAKLLQDQKVFGTTGDTIKDLFGKHFVVNGILEETNTSMDRMYFVPLGQSAFG
ncbi:hypothetical protein HY988_07465 [Candidatus Micrarchaeota archaeon]|nr:hypothetical protein [Candidatus Micrarchaeota archaeon]